MFPMTSLSLPPATSNGRSTKSKRHKRRTTTVRTISPNEYASAVHEYWSLSTGAGQNHATLAQFLTSDDPTTIDIDSQGQQVNDAVIIYQPISNVEEQSDPSHSRSPSRSAPRSNGNETTLDVPDERESSSDKRHEIRKYASFNNANELRHFSFGATAERQSSIIIMSGYMTATWIKSIGGRFKVDPEFFCRHLDMRRAGDSSNNFSIPALPSTSWHLIELPVLTLGSRSGLKESIQQDKIEDLRSRGKDGLTEHHQKFSKLSTSSMALGDSLVRDYFVFDETHFAVEQRISICMQAHEGGKTFDLLIWLDSGRDPAQGPKSPPWAVQRPASFLLPIIRHKYMIALKSHLFATPLVDDADVSVQPSTLVHEYGRSLRPGIMAVDAFYCLTEVLNFAASSQIQFLNLIDVKLDLYTSQSPEEEHQSLPNLKYTKQLLYRFIQKTERVLDSIENAKTSRWPKASNGGDTVEASKAHGSAQTALRSVEQDFKHLLSYASALHKRTTEAITDLRASVSIAESQKGIQQAQQLGSLTFLAFVFVPFSFTTSFFGMNVSQLRNGQLGLGWWALMTVLVTGAAAALFFIDFIVVSKRVWRGLRLSRTDE